MWVNISQYLALAVLSYLLGAIPFGLLLGKIARGIDLREYGSGKTGASNVLRTLGLGASAVVLSLDVAKGVGPVLMAEALLGEGAAQVVAGLAALVGHNWSLYIRFQGGRGIATGFGVLLVLSPPVAAAAFLVWTGFMAVFQYVSLGSIAGTVIAFLALVTLVALGREPLIYLAYAVAAAAIVLLKHRDNLRRLSVGREPKLGGRARRRPRVRRVSRTSG